MSDEKEEQKLIKALRAVPEVAGCANVVERIIKERDRARRQRDFGREREDNLLSEVVTAHDEIKRMMRGMFCPATPDRLHRCGPCNTIVQTALPTTQPVDGDRTGPCPEEVLPATLMQVSDLFGDFVAEKMIELNHGLPLPQHQLLAAKMAGPAISGALLGAVLHVLRKATSPTAEENKSGKDEKNNRENER